MQDVQQVALDAESAKVSCELKARCDAVKAERATNGGARAKDCVRGGPIGDGRRAWRYSSPPALKEAVAEQWSERRWPRGLGKAAEAIAEASSGRGCVAFDHGRSFLGPSLGKSYS